jgi:hypothetical protein
MQDKQTAGAILSRFKFDPWNLMGPRNKQLRQQLMLAITGKRVPVAKCGVNALQRELRQRIDTSAATCQAREPEIFRAYFTT